MAMQVGGSVEKKKIARILETLFFFTFNRMSRSTATSTCYVGFEFEPTFETFENFHFFGGWDPLGPGTKSNK